MATQPRASSRRRRSKRGGPNIYDIAAQAGVSISMVSRVMNGSGYVAEAKRERVLEVLRKHDYQPSAAARSLARRDRNVFGVLVGNSGAEYSQLFASRILAGVADSCRSAHRNVMLLWCDSDTQPKQLMEEARQSVDGLILLDVQCDSAGSEQLREAETPAVLVNEPAASGGEASVVVDNRQGGRLAVQHLIEAGHRRIALIMGGLHLHVGRDRYEGAMAALDDAGLSCADEWMVDASFQPGKARAAIRSMFGDGKPEPPTGLFVASDLMAFAVLDELRTLGLGVPEDVSVVGFDNSLIAPLSHPPLTSVEQPLVEMGREAAELLGQIIRDPKQKRTITLPVSLCERESVRRLAPSPQ